MTIHELAGKPAPESILVNVPRLIAAYYELRPDPSRPGQRVSFGTSGHRGSSLAATFNQDHILAITQAICDFRRERKIDGPLYLGMDTHPLSESAHASTLEVLAANGVPVRFAASRAYTPTPVISHAILTHNREKGQGLADGIVITPSHNPPEDGGFKYNPPHGGPADTADTRWIEQRANTLLEEGNRGVKRIPLERAERAETVQAWDFVTPYVGDLEQVVDLQVVRASGLKLGVDPMGGAGLGFWEPIAERYGLDLTIVNTSLDPRFAFMTVDWDGKIRMDCSSPYAMAGLIALKDRFDVAFGNDTDYDRHGIVTRSGGLLHPNHYLSAAVHYLFQIREGWGRQVAVGKTLVSSSMIDRVSASLSRTVVEVPVGFKWFVEGLLQGSFGFAGEESAGASFLRRDGTVWTTDKDGFILDLLAAEMTARTGKDPAQHYRELTGRFGDPVYERIDAPATPSQKEALRNLSPEHLPARELAGEKILAVLTRAPGNQAPIGGVKVVAENGWFAARPSGTEEVYKIYAESFQGVEHLRAIQEEARALVEAAFATAGV